MTKFSIKSMNNDRYSYSYSSNKKFIIVIEGQNFPVIIYFSEINLFESNYLELKAITSIMK